MKGNAIYFPYIQVPKNEWFTRALIYFDQIGSIVPLDYESNLSEYMQDLIQEGLVNPIHPAYYVDDIPYFTEAFLDYVDSPDYPVSKEVIKRKKLPTLKIHVEKLGPIGNELVKRGLAQKRDWRWYNIESYTANKFMAYLANVLGELPDFKSDPITDSIPNLSSFAPYYYQEGNLPQKIDELRTLVLKDILPAPKENISPKKIADFKMDHKKELIRFRNEIESFLLDVAGIEDPLLRSKRINQFTEKTHDSINELSDLMKSRGWKKITLGKFIAYSAAGFGLSSAVISGGLTSVVAAAFGVGSAIYNTVQDSKSNNISKGEYAAYALLAKEF